MVPLPFLNKIKRRLNPLMKNIYFIAVKIPKILRKRRKIGDLHAKHLMMYHRLSLII